MYLRIDRTCAEWAAILTNVFRDERWAISPGRIKDGMGGAVVRGMVRLTVSLDAASVRAAQDLIDAFQFLIPATRLEVGSLGCRVWKGPGPTVHYTEEWITESAMRDRVRSQAFTTLLAIIESVQHPRVQFDFVTSTRGLDYLAEIRTSNTGL